MPEIDKIGLAGVSSLFQNGRLDERTGIIKVDLFGRKRRQVEGILNGLPPVVSQVEDPDTSIH